MSSILRNIARSSPYTIYLSGILVSLITGKPLAAIFTLSALIFGEGLNFILKHLFKAIGPNKTTWQRPSPPSDGCGIYPVCGETQTTWGMPSGHAQVISFSAIFWILYMWRKGHASTIWTLTGTSLIIIIATLIMYSRILEGCHTLQQVIAGGIFGFVMGILCYFTLESYRPQWFE